MRPTPLAISAIAFITFLCAAPAYGLEWSEIMFNPDGNDNGREFIELIGNESLEGCVINDSASSDKLILNRTGGSGIILIIETDHLFADALGDATLYTIGAAIGNGLGNAAEGIIISCDGTTVLATAYNVSLIEGYGEGASIIMLLGRWMPGPMNGTPGSIPSLADPSDHPLPEPPRAADTEERCDGTLLVALNTTSVEAGGHVRIEIASAGYAAFDITADGTPFASGDTLTTRAHTIIAPDAKELKVVATARECDARQRAVRYLRITPRPNPSSDDVAVPGAEEMAAADVPLAAPAPPHPITEAEPTEAVPSSAPLATGAAVERTVIDEDRDAVPWIAAFGMVTVLASAAVFLQLLRRGEA